MTDPPSSPRPLRVGAGAGLVGFLVLAVAVRLRWPPVGLDLRIARRLNAATAGHPAQIRLWLDLSTALDPTVLRLAALVAAVALAGRGRLRAATQPAVIVLGTAVLSPLTKLLVDRDRPRLPIPIDHAAGQSYPSGHAMTSFAAAAAVLVLGSPRARRLLAVPLALLVLAVGYARLALGVHYLSDVVGGWLLGLAWTCAVTLLARRFGDSTSRGRRGRKGPSERQPAQE